MQGAASGREVPANVDAERAILNQILLNGRSDLLIAARIVQPECFFNPGYRTIYEAMLAIARMGANPADVVLLTNWLRAHGKLQEAGGPACIFNVIGA